MLSKDRKIRIGFSRLAQQDIDDILQYTYKTWGKNQVLKYKEFFERGWKTLILNPDIGHYRPDIPNGCFALNIEKHIAIYTFKESKIYILRILHSRMNFNNKI